MEYLPDHLILDILNRLTDSGDLARSRIACRSFNSLSRHVKFINLVCSSSRYLRSRSPATRSLTTPFKSIVRASIYGSIGSGAHLESISIGVEDVPELSYDNVGDDSGDDLYLTDVNFLREWFPRVCEGLRELSISDFWVQSCWRRSHVLGLVSSYCHNLLRLDLKKAWLSVDGLTPLPKLTSLTLNFIRIDDEDLNKINTCFPSLQSLNLLGVGGLKDPKISLLHLKTCQWAVSNVPSSLSIYAPNLEKLKLRCVKPRSLILQAPSLSDFSLSIVRADVYEVACLSNLRCLKLSSPNLCSFIEIFSPGSSVENLTLSSFWNKELNSEGNLTENTNPEVLFKSFPLINSLTVGPGALGFEFWFKGMGWGDQTLDEISWLRELVVYLTAFEIDITEPLISSVLSKTCNLKEMTILVHEDIDPKSVRSALSRLSRHWSQVRWKLGIWKKVEDTESDPYGSEIVRQPQVFK
ncbi:hypothetical protein SAY86_025739 [Trapa natans]|uniref:F-box domain-containing protein n=1 Tax=Trapa natans TaxID=22666 RepID=A0AAN7KCK9_TRANT|nr:hypothetical protein SAY86_025739 [Trapa natans]